MDTHNFNYLKTFIKELIITEHDIDRLYLNNMTQTKSISELIFDYLIQLLQQYRVEEILSKKNEIKKEISLLIHTKDSIKTNLNDYEENQKLHNDEKKNTLIQASTTPFEKMSHAYTKYVQNVSDKVSIQKKLLTYLWRGTKIKISKEMKSVIAEHKVIPLSEVEKNKFKKNKLTPFKIMCNEHKTKLQATLKNIEKKELNKVLSYIWNNKIGKMSEQTKKLIEEHNIKPLTNEEKQKYQ